MLGRRLAGLLGTLVVAAAIVLGVYSLVTNYWLESAGELVPTAASIVVVAAFCFGLFVLGAKSDRWLRNPYW